MQFIARTLASARTPLSRRQRLGLLALLVVGTGLLLAGCASTRPPPGVTAVTPFDVQRYAGRWYELARLDHAFERGMTDVTATYTAQADGSVRVVNRGYAPATGQWREAVGKALFTGAPTTGSLKVSFFGPFYGGYNVVALDPAYQWALVIGSSVDSMWILSRKPYLSDEVRGVLLAKARALGVDENTIVWVQQDGVNPTGI